MVGVVLDTMSNYLLISVAYSGKLTPLYKSFKEGGRFSLGFGKIVNLPPLEPF